MTWQHGPMTYGAERNGSIKKSPRGKRRGKSKRCESVTFVVKIEDWHVTYSFFLDLDRRVTGGPYWEHMSLNIKGRFVMPDRLSGRDVERTILADRQEVTAVMKPVRIGDVHKCINNA